MDTFTELTRLLARLRDPDLMERFLREILTPSETRDLGSRWELLKRLEAGETQRQIATELGVSLCKITRGSRELKRPGSALKAVLALPRPRPH
ncbi:MAG: transcriptional regulator [Acidobacteria bacterium]|nr:transcriptional regulator [Acidobacteriota bacterium]